MKIVEINYGTKGSTGNIMLNIANIVRREEGQAYTFSCPKKQMKHENHSFFGLKIENLIHRAFGVLTGISGTGSKIGTYKLIKAIKRIKPDVIHLHNLHGWYINLPMLFSFLKKEEKRVFWTLHDCWAFTAQCAHFSIEGCDKWKTGCFSCPRCNIYPNSLVDNTKKMYRHKKQWFTGVKDLTIVTPSHWLAELVGESFLKDYPVKVIHNGIDLSVFKPTGSDFRTKYNCEDKFILLGVAFGWGFRKGLDVFVELASRLDNRFQIVLVGTDDNVDRNLPANIISIHRTQNQSELAEIYTAADLFVNPTREDTYPTVNMESLACGTPVVTFRTGGSPESIDETCGTVVPCDDIDALEQEILRIAETTPYPASACLEKAKEFDMNERFEEYVRLYTEVQK